MSEEKDGYYVIGNSFVKASELALMQKIRKRFEYRLLFHPEWSNDKLRKKRELARLSVYPLSFYAWIVVGSTRKMAWVTKDCKIAFKINDYANSWMPWSKFTFERWCTGFDL